MINWFKNLLSSEKIIDNASSGIDKIVLTAEEKTDYFLKFIEASMPMNIARRFIAIAVTLFWLLCGLLIIFLILFDAKKLPEIVEFANVYVMPPFTILVSFYFFKRLKQ